MKNKSFRYSKIQLRSLSFLLLLVLVGHTLFAQQVEIAVSNKVRVEIVSEKEIQRYSSLHPDYSHSRLGVAMRKTNKVQQLFKNQVIASQYEIVTRLGENKDVRFVHQFTPKTNFVLRIRFMIMIDEIPMDINVKGQMVKEGVYSHGVYYMRVIFELQDVITMEVVTMDPMYRMKIITHQYMSAEELFNRFWIKFLSTAVPRAGADILGPIVKSYKSKVTGEILFDTKNGEAPKANGKQISTISVHLNGKAAGGERYAHSISKYKLTCEKGVFIETNSNEIEFTAADYIYEGHGGKHKYNTKYRVYKCKDYDKDERDFDKFTLVQSQNLAGKSNNRLDIKKVNFKCENRNTYEIYAYYNAPGFAKVRLKWPASKIAFPAEGASPQVVNYQTLMQANPNAKMEDIHDDNGKPLHFPFTIVYPQQRHTIYGGPGEDGTTVLYVGTLGGNGFYKNFDVKLSSEALNSCEISRENGGPVYLNLGFDLFGGAGQKGPSHQISPNWEQLTVTAWDPKTFLLMGQKMKRNPWPVDFPPILITKEDIEKFKTFEKVEKTVSNGRATLKVVFQPAEEKNNE